jgi:hypothetical protein
MTFIGMTWQNDNKENDIDQGMTFSRMTFSIITFLNANRQDDIQHCDIQQNYTKQSDNHQNNTKNINIL